MKLAFLLAALLLTASPAAAQTGGAQTAGELYEQGVAARHSGDNERSAELLRSAVTMEPGNADAQLQLGLALLALDRLDEADSAFRQTLRIAPDYADARIGLARVAQRRGDRSGALAALALIDRNNADAQVLRSQLKQFDPEHPSWTVDLDLSHSDLEGGQPSWKEATLGLRHQASDATSIGASVLTARRFNRTDVYILGRVDHRLPGGHSITFTFGGTPNSDFSPKLQIGAGGALKVSGGPHATVLTLEARQARYNVGDIQVVTPGIEQYIAGRVWVAVQWINVFDQDGKRTSGVMGRADFQATDRLRLFAGLASAPDTSEGRVVDVVGKFGGLSYDVSARHSVRLSLAHEDRETGSDRFHLGVGLSTRF